MVSMPSALSCRASSRPPLISLTSASRRLARREGIVAQAACLRHGRERLLVDFEHRYEAEEPGWVLRVGEHMAMECPGAGVRRLDDAVIAAPRGHIEVVALVR